MEQYCSKRGHRQYLKRGGGCSNLTILWLLWLQRCLLSESGTLFIYKGVFCGTHTKSGSVLLHFCMEILPCGWLNHEIGPWYYFMGLLTLKGSHICIIEFLLIQLIIKMKFSLWEEVSRYLYNSAFNCEI